MISHAPTEISEGCGSLRLSATVSIDGDQRQPANPVNSQTPSDQRILIAAHALFYRDGIRATGVDKIIETSQVSKVTFYRWKAKFSGMQVSDAKRLRQLEEENRRHKHMVADQALDIQAL